MGRVGGVVDGVRVWGVGGHARADLGTVAVVGRGGGGGLVEGGRRGLVGVAVHLVGRVHGVGLWRAWVGCEVGGKGGRGLGLGLGLLADV